MTPFPPEDAGAKPTRVARHPDGVKWICYSPDGRRLLSKCADDAVRVWDTATWQEISQLRGDTRAIKRAVFSYDGSLLFTPDGDGAARLWDFERGRPIRHYQGLKDATAFAFTPDRTRILGGARTGSVHVWDINTGAAIAEYEIHSGPIVALASSSDGRRDFSASWKFATFDYRLNLGKTSLDGQGKRRLMKRLGWCVAHVNIRSR